MNNRPAPNHHETREDFLTRGKRKNALVPVRHSFVQQGTQRDPEPGPLARLVTRHDMLGLDLYLLALARAVAPVRSEAHGGDAEFSVVAHSAVWARMLQTSTSSVSRALGRLEQDHQLIRREPSGRYVDVVVLSEDGSGDPYERPTGAADQRYLQLSYDYWLSGPRAGVAWVDQLSLPAKAMLLVALTLQPPFRLPVARTPRWYGWSEDSGQRGFATLRDEGLMRSTPEWRKTASQTKSGWTEDFKHTLLSPFNFRRPKATVLKAVS